MIGRDLKRERLIAKSSGPLKVWQPSPTPAVPKVTSKDASKWLREHERIQRELKAAKHIEGDGIGPEFGADLV